MDSKKKRERRGLVIALTEHAQNVMDERFANNPLPKQQQVERIMEFLAAAPESFQLLMTGPIPSDMRVEMIDKAIAYLETLKTVPPSGVSYIGQIGGPHRDHRPKRSPRLSRVHASA